MRKVYKSPGVQKLIISVRDCGKYGHLSPSYSGILIKAGLGEVHAQGKCTHCGKKIESIGPEAYGEIQRFYEDVF